MLKQDVVNVHALQFSTALSVYIICVLYCPLLYYEYGGLHKSGAAERQASLLVQSNEGNLFQGLNDNSFTVIIMY